MPIYEYQCKNCHHHFDLMQKVSEPPVKQCPQCFESSVIRLVSAPGFQLKGSGWYVTDFKDKKPAESKKEGAVEQASDKKTSETTTTETKTTSKPKGESE